MFFHTLVKVSSSWWGTLSVNHLSEAITKEVWNMWKKLLLVVALVGSMGLAGCGEINDIEEPADIGAPTEEQSI